MAVRFLTVLLLFSTVAAAAPQAKSPRKDPKFWKRVDASIDKGVDWLLAQQQANGRWTAFEGERGAVYELGMQAICMLACIKGGVPPDDRKMQKAWRALDVLYEKQKNNLHTYEVGVTLMLLDAHVTTKPRKRHGKKGKKGKRELSAEWKARAKTLAVWLGLKQKPEGMWRYPNGGVDLSNTQYAALGPVVGSPARHRTRQGGRSPHAGRGAQAAASARLRVPFYPIPRAPFARMQKKGAESRSGTMIDARGWRYAPPERVKSEGKVVERVFPYSGSMTSAGVACLAIGRDILGKKDPWLRDKDSQGAPRDVGGAGVAAGQLGRGRTTRGNRPTGSSTGCTVSSARGSYARGLHRASRLVRGGGDPPHGRPARRRQLAAETAPDGARQRRFALGKGPAGHRFRDPLPDALDAFAQAQAPDHNGGEVAEPLGRKADPAASKA